MLVTWISHWNSYVAVTRVTHAFCVFSHHISENVGVRLIISTKAFLRTYEGTYEGTIERSGGGLVDVHPLREVCLLHFLNRNMSKSHVETIRLTTNSTRVDIVPWRQHVYDGLL